MTMTTAETPQQYDDRRQLEAETNAEDTAAELRGILAGELYRDDFGNFEPLPEEPDTDHECDEALRYEDHECEQCATLAEALEAFEEIEPATLLDWLEELLEVVVHYDAQGNPVAVHVVITTGGPSVYTEADTVRWSHGQAEGGAYVAGLHNALLDLAFEGCI